VSPPREQTLRERLAAGEISSVDATERFLARIELVDDDVGAYITVAAESALEEARAADEALERGSLLGPLHGLPVALKDNIETRGLRTTMGSAFFRDNIPAQDAEVAARLRRAGAVVLGKATLHEFAYGATNDNAHFGPCRNPWDLGRIPGGSSGGSGAAVAAGLCAASLGTDTGGSVRIPAALTGVSALRPSDGRVSLSGVFATTWTFDTVGPIARSVDDLAALIAVLAGYDDRDPRSVDAPVAAYEAALGAGIERMRVGIPRNFYFDDVDADIVALVRAAADVLASAGAELVELDLPGADDAVVDTTEMIKAEAYAIHRGRLDRDPGRFGDGVRRRLELGRSISGADYALHRERARSWIRTVKRAFEDVDVILAPSTGTTAPPAGSEMIETTQRLVRLTYGWSLAGLPALSLPCGLSDDGLPVGLQLAAPKLGEATLLRAGAAYQQATGWHLLEPPVATTLKGEA
jgi:aspartyl-tRNA(Asn)/glutamyl-tRNA(Gln) amidotransferase subunit A